MLNPEELTREIVTFDCGNILSFAFPPLALLTAAVVVVVAVVSPNVVSQFVPEPVKVPDLMFEM